MTAHADAPMEGTPLIRPSTTDHPLYDQVVEACRTVYDPEIPVNIYDLGLVYTIEISGENDVDVAMSLTAPGCPVAAEMPGWVADAITPIPGVRHVERRAGLGTAVGHGHDVRRGPARARLHVGLAAPRRGRHGPRSPPPVAERCRSPSRTPLAHRPTSRS